jgi:hypothetical protein
VKQIAIAATVLASFTLCGCVTKVVTAPIKAVSKATDWATTSGDEADRARGRALRKKCKERYDPYYCEK